MILETYNFSNGCVMGHLILSVILFFSSCGGVSINTGGAAPRQTEYHGKLETTLVPNEGPSSSMASLKMATVEERAKLPATLSSEDQAFAGRLKPDPSGHLAVEVILVEPLRNAAYLYADVDLDGTFGGTERFSFSPVKDDPRVEGIMLKVPLPTGPYHDFPILVQHYKANDSHSKSTNRQLLYTLGALVRGVVDIEGRKTLVQYSIDPATGKVDPTNGQIGIDGNGDGRIDRSPSPPSSESFNVDNETIVFRVGDHYVSTKTVDTATGEVVLIAHPSSDYQIIELRTAADVPDFSFTDVNGKPRKLSDFRGRYLLIDIWATWCKGCVADIPRIKEIYAKYQPRGFEILGLDNEVVGEDVAATDIAEELQRVKTFIATKGITWTQASPETSKDLVEKRFRVTGYPTMVILDPQSKIVSLGVKTETLPEELEKLLPHSTN
jgi:thiol-disulfide isomerase/thioredoxin